MRGYVLRTLFVKEARRVALHRGTGGMVLLLLVAAVLLSAVGARALEGTLGSTSASRCVVDTWDESPWVAHLRASVPDTLRARVSFRRVGDQPGMIRYPNGAVGIQLRPTDAGGYKIWTWHPPGDEAAATWCEAWLWRETRLYFLEAVGPSDTTRALALRDIGAIAAHDDAWALREAHARFRERIDPGGSKVPRLDVERSPFRSVSGAGAREAVAMGLTLLALFFVGIFLLPSMTCEERERGVLAAIALSPASPGEIVGAKLGFYFLFAFALAATLSGIAAPAALGRPFFWATLAAVALASVAIGFSIASLSKTQRGASLGALSYLFATGILLITGKDSALEPVTWLLVERHGPELLLAALAGVVRRAQWVQLGFSSALALVWVAVASACYRRFGWR